MRVGGYSYVKSRHASRKRRYSSVVPYGSPEVQPPSLWFSILTRPLSRIPHYPTHVFQTQLTYFKLNSLFSNSTQRYELNPRFSNSTQCCELNSNSTQRCELNSRFSNSTQRSELNSRFSNSTQRSELNSRFSLNVQLKLNPRETGTRDNGIARRKGSSESRRDNIT